MNNPPSFKQLLKYATWTLTGAGAFMVATGNVFGWYVLLCACIGWHMVLSL